MPVDFDALTSAAVLAAFAERELVLFKPQDGGPTFELPGIFSREQVLVESDGHGPPASVTRTTLGVREADLPYGATFVRVRVLLRGVTYDVRNPSPDGMGWVILELGRIG